MVHCVDEKTGYIYHSDYAKEFHDFSKADVALRTAVEIDFVANLTSFLVNSVNLSPDSCMAIAKSLFWRMSVSTHYYTPYRVLSIFQFAYDNDISLEDYEHLAIWFHSAVYFARLKDGENPKHYSFQHSAHFMRSTIPGGLFMNNKLVCKASDLIFELCRNFSDTNLQSFAKLTMDLCHYHFCLPFDDFQIAEQCLRKEWQGFYSRREYEADRYILFENLLKEDKIFYTDIMNERCAELAKRSIAATRKPVMVS